MHFLLFLNTACIYYVYVLRNVKLTCASCMLFWRMFSGLYYTHIVATVSSDLSTAPGCLSPPGQSVESWWSIHGAPCVSSLCLTTRYLLYQKLKWKEIDKSTNRLKIVFHLSVIKRRKDTVVKD